MVRNPLRRVAEIDENVEAIKQEVNTTLPPRPLKADEADLTRVIEREINLSLLNDKINFNTELLLKIAEACEIDLS